MTPVSPHPERNDAMDAPQGSVREAAQRLLNEVDAILGRPRSAPTPVVFSDLLREMAGIAHARDALRAALESQTGVPSGEKAPQSEAEHLLMILNAARDAHGCTDHGCMWGHRGGMGTNGGCGCQKNLRYGSTRPLEAGRIANALRAARVLAEKLVANRASGEPSVPPPSEPTVFAWLIEDMVTKLGYWGGVRGWTQNHLEAVRFARREDAESVVMSLPHGWHLVGAPVQHGWAPDGLAVAFCPTCKQESRFRHLHEPAYDDMPQTHMAGSERFECAFCGFAVWSHMAADFPTLTFVLDVERAK